MESIHYEQKGNLAFITLNRPDAMSEADIQLYSEEAHRIITSKLTRAARAVLGL